MIEFEVNRQSQLFKDQLEKSKDYAVSQIRPGEFSVTNENTHTVEIQQIDDLQFWGSCDCSDFHFRVMSGERDYCKHLIAVVIRHKAAMTLTFRSKAWRTSQTPKM